MSGLHFNLLLWFTIAAVTAFGSPGITAEPLPDEEAAAAELEELGFIVSAYSPQHVKIVHRHKGRGTDLEMRLVNRLEEFRGHHTQLAALCDELRTVSPELVGRKPGDL